VIANPCLQRCSHVVVLDGFFGERERTGLFGLMTSPGWDQSQGPCPDQWTRSTCDAEGLPAVCPFQFTFLLNKSTSEANQAHAAPASGHYVRGRMISAARYASYSRHSAVTEIHLRMQSWGLRPEILDALLAGDAWAAREIQVRGAFW
jgi:hypothetical protein